MRFHGNFFMNAPVSREIGPGSINRLLKIPHDAEALIFRRIVAQSGNSQQDLKLTRVGILRFIKQDA